MGLHEKYDTLERRVGQLEDTVSELGKAASQIIPYLQHRTQVIHQAFELNDSHIWTLHMITEDLLMGRVRVWPPHPDVVKEANIAKALGERGPSLERFLQPPCMLHPDARIDMVWYAEQYALLRSALVLASYLADVAKGEQDGTGTEP